MILMNIRLTFMTPNLCRQYYSKFEADPDLYIDPQKYHPYVYDPEKCDEHFIRYRQLKRIYLAIMLNDEPIGEVILKNIDKDQQCCTLGIHLQNNSVKNKGYGTRAEILAIQYAFNELGMENVYADAIHKNKRSQHVLRKVGFIETGYDEEFIYYQCCKASWIPPAL